MITAILTLDVAVGLVLLVMAVPNVFVVPMSRIEARERFQMVLLSVGVLAWIGCNVFGMVWVN